MGQAQKQKHGHEHDARLPGEHAIAVRQGQAKMLAAMPAGGDQENGAILPRLLVHHHGLNGGGDFHGVTGPVFHGAFPCVPRLLPLSRKETALFWVNMSFSTRLKAERKRLKITQKRLAEMAGVTEQAQVSYEKERQPQFASYLEALAREGLDVAYILTGERGGVQLTEEEAEMLSLIRRAAPEVRATALDVLRTGTVITKSVHVGRDNYGPIRL